MCGIVAIYSPGGAANRDSLLRAMNALQHRGPDGQGFHISQDATIALGHTRLAIIGLEDGAQPIANEDGTINIVVNGEFYDFERIRADLQKRGHQFRTHSDAEIAIHLYEEYDVDCLEYLRGEFAFVIWDEKRKRLFAARDRFGIKPLVWARKEESLLLASEAKALFAAGVRAAWDQESFFHAANLQYTLPHRTLFQAVSQLQPGHMLLAENGKLEISRYWDLNYRVENGSAKAFDEAQAIEEFGELLSESIRLRLRADIPVCAHLSGGLDSSAIVGLAMRYSGAQIECFCVSFEESSYDEFDIAREMAKHAGTQVHAVNVSQSDLLQHLPDAVYYSEGLAVNGHLSAKYLLHKEIRRLGFKVALTGEGSDELVAGYPHLRSDLFRWQGKEELLPELHASNAASQGIMLQHGKTLPLSAVRKRLDYVPSFLEAKGSLGYRLCSVLSDEFISRFKGRDCYEELLACFDIGGQLSGRSWVNQSSYLWSKTALANYILKTLGDGTEMASAVEGRLPFLDHHLFEYAAALPVSFKIKDTVEKHILREAVRPYITETVYKRRKHPFVAPPISRFSGAAGQALLQDTLRSKSFQSLAFFDGVKVRALLDKLPDMAAEERAVVDPVFMTLLSAAALQQRLGLQEAA